MRRNSFYSHLHPRCGCIALWIAHRERQPSGAAPIVADESDALQIKLAHECSQIGGMAVESVSLFACGLFGQPNPTMLGTMTRRPDLTSGPITSR